MDTLDNWHKSSHSGPGDGDSCVEIAGNPSRVGIRDTKNRAHGPLTFSSSSFTPFLDSLKCARFTPMPHGTWRRSSHSGGGDGNACVEIAHRSSRIAVRDSKAPARATLAFPAGAFFAFLDALKAAQFSG
jgi:hypothetical protein